MTRTMPPTQYQRDRFIPPFLTALLLMDVILIIAFVANLA